ncbi:MAG: hypothetical protein ACRECO_16410 [Xanthobacteraceae bacterium]
MLTQHPTLLIGPADWDAGRMPKAEFERRIAALWDAFPDRSQAIVFGSASRHAELAYLTNFVPKLEPGIALITREGPPKLLFGGGPNMVGAMKPLTFIAEMAPLNALTKSIAGWKPLLIGGGYMPQAVRKSIADATGSTAQDATAQIRAMMRQKSPAELNAVREACTALQAAMAAVGDAAYEGAGVISAVLAGEKAAIEAGAQDVRTLFSLDGGRTLRPFETLDDRRADPLQVYIAVRRFNYWAEGFASISNRAQPAAALAALLLENALSAIALGVPTAQLAKILAVGAPYRDHPVTQGALTAPLGLALDSPSPAAFEAGEVYSVRCGLTDGVEQHAIVSAMIAVREGGNDVLWRNAVA